MFNCNSFGAEGIGENNRNRNARQLEGYTGPWVWRTFGICISYVGFLKKCFHLVICISIFDGSPDFRYKTVYWLWPGTIHKTASVVIPANFRRVFASHLTSGHPFNWFFFSICVFSSIFCCSFFFATDSHVRFNQMYQHVNSKTEELGNVALRNGRKLQNLILKIKINF